jgi:hypothetical protein
VLVYAHRLHLISLFVFRASGLYWPARDGSALTTQERGFNVVMWRQSSLGYVLVPDLVSDVERRELASLAAKLLSMPGRGARSKARLTTDATQRRIRMSKTPTLKEPAGDDRRHSE